MERKKLIIEARINEYMMREHNLHAPWTPEEIARPARGARDGCDDRALACSPA